MLSRAPFPVKEINTHICDDSVAIVGGHEIFYCTRRCILQLVATDKVVRKLEFRSVGAAGNNWHRTVGVRLDTVAIDFSHCGALLKAARC